MTEDRFEKLKAEAKARAEAALKDPAIIARKEKFAAMHAAGFADAEMMREFGVSRVRLADMRRRLNRKLGLVK